MDVFFRNILYIQNFYFIINYTNYLYYNEHYFNFYDFMAVFFKDIKRFVGYRRVLITNANVS